MTPATGALLSAALSYAKKGYPVFPILANQKAPPLIKEWQKQATTDTERITEWWTQWPDANIGIHCVGLTVIDIDGKDNPWLTNLKSTEHVELLKAPFAVTPRGGRHVVFKGSTKTGVAKLAEKVDTRSDGGYIVVYPSTVDGKLYQWVQELTPVDTLPPVPEWVKTVLSTQVLQNAKPTETNGTVEKIPEGRRDDFIFRYACRLRRLGMTLEEIDVALQEINKTRCTPPLPASQITQKAKQAYKYEPEQSEIAVLEGWFEQDREETPVEKYKDPGPMPKHLLAVSGLIEKVMNYNLETAFKPQPLLALAGALALQSVLAARKVRDIRNNRTNLYILGVAKSGSGKDHSRKINRNILFESGLTELESNEDFASDAGLIGAVAHHPACLFQVDEVGRLLRTTREAMNSNLYNLQSILLKLYTSADTIYKGKAYSDRTRNVEIDQPCMVLHGLTVPEHFYNGLSHDNLIDGFLARMLVFDVTDIAPRAYNSDKPIPLDILEIVKTWKEFKLAGNLSAEHPTPFLVPTTPDAEKLFRDFAAKVEKYTNGKDPVAETLWSRAEQKACRLALVSACSRHPSKLEITATDMSWALELTDHLTRKMMWLSGLWVAHNSFDAAQKKVLRAVRDAGGVVTKNQLARLTQYLSIRERGEILQNLLTTGQLNESKKGTGTRGPSPAVYFLSEFKTDTEPKANSA